MIRWKTHLNYHCKRLRLWVWIYSTYTSGPMSLSPLAKLNTKSSWISTSVWIRCKSLEKMKLSNLQAILEIINSSNINRHPIFHTKRKRIKTFSKAIKALKATGVRIADKHNSNRKIIEDHPVRNWEPTPLFHKSIEIILVAYPIASRSESTTIKIIIIIMELKLWLKRNWLQTLLQIVAENIDSLLLHIIVSRSSDIIHLSARVALEWVNQCRGSQNRIVWSIYTLNRTWP